MYAYRYRHLKKKKINLKSIVIVMVLVAMALLVTGGLSPFLQLHKEWKIACYEEIVELYMPGVVCCVDEGADATVAERILSHFFPAVKETEKTKEYKMQVESELSYEAILAREAADENYVDDKTGELIETGSMDDDAVESAGTSLQDMPQVAVAEGGQDNDKVVTYAREKLNDFDYLMQNFYRVDSTTTINSSQLNGAALLAKDLRLSHDASTPQILIYHTHSQEAYADSVPGDASMTVVGVGDYLTTLLTEKYGFSVIHHKGEYDVGDRDHAYSKAAPAVEQILAENPSIEVVIDLHRDGVQEGTRLVTDLNGVQTAQIMFFNGLSRTTSTGDIDYLYNPYIADNLAMSFQMQLNAAEYYPDFTRRIYLKGYRYNMHYCPKTLLIEVGAQTNTLQEAMNAMVPLADILNKVLTGAQQTQ